MPIHEEDAHLDKDYQSMDDKDRNDLSRKVSKPVNPLGNKASSTNSDSEDFAL